MLAINEKIRYCFDESRMIYEKRNKEATFNFNWSAYESY